MQTKRNHLDRQAIFNLFDQIDITFNYFPLSDIPHQQELFHLMNIVEKNCFSKKGTWSHAQEKFLNIIVLGVCLRQSTFPNQMNIQQWEEVSKLFAFQSWKTCRNKWLSQKQAKVGWTPDEDKALIELYYQYPNKWCEIAIELMKKCRTFYARQGKQCRDRWVNKLDPNISKDPWSKEEELKLFQEVKQKGKRWAEISLNVFQLKRTENNIKNRYYNIIKQELNKTKLGKVSNEEKESVVLSNVIKRLQQNIKNNMISDDISITKIQSYEFAQFSFCICKDLQLILIKGRKLVKLNENL